MNSINLILAIWDAFLISVYLLFKYSEPKHHDFKYQVAQELHKSYGGVDYHI
jgi:hypothetical protein